MNDTRLGRRRAAGPSRQSALEAHPKNGPVTIVSGTHLRNFLIACHQINEPEFGGRIALFAIRNMLLSERHLQGQREQPEIAPGDCEDFWRVSGKYSALLRVSLVDCGRGLPVGLACVGV